MPIHYTCSDRQQRATITILGPFNAESAWATQGGGWVGIRPALRPPIDDRLPVDGYAPRVRRPCSSRSRANRGAARSRSSWDVRSARH
jgi:hypothetical protein